MNHIFQTSIAAILLAASAAIAADAPRELTKDERAEVQQLPRKFAAARNDAQARSAVVDDAIRLGPLGVARLTPLIQKEVTAGLTRYSNLFKLRARGKTDADAETIVGGDESLQAMRASLLEAGALLVRLQAASGQTSASAVEQLQAAETQFLREVRLGPILSQISDVELEAIEETNKQRAAHQLAPLQLDIKLCLAARDHAADMVKHGFFSHISPVQGKTTPVDRARRFGTTASAENIHAGAQTGAEAVNAWMNSEGHRANILTPTYHRIGVGKHGDHWTQMFGE